MIEFSCSGCGQRLRADPADAGRAIKCPRCKLISHVPPSAPPIRAQTPTGAPNRPGTETEENQQSGDLGYSDDRTLSSYPGNDQQPEPWFFKYITFFAYLMLAIGVFGFSVALFVVFIIFVGALAKTGEMGTAVVAVVSAIYLVWFAICLLCVIFWSAMILLVLDMARSFRSLRSIASSIEQHWR